MDARTAARIEALKEAFGWDDLKTVLEEGEQKFWKRHIADVKAGKPIDQRELDRALGKIEGIRAILGAPEKAAAILLRERGKEEEPRE